MNAFLTAFISHLLTLLFLSILLLMETRKMDLRHNATIRAVACFSVGLLLCALFAFLEGTVSATIAPYLGLVLDASLYLLLCLSVMILVSTNHSTHFFIDSVVLLCEFPIRAFTSLIMSVLSLLSVYTPYYAEWLTRIGLFLIVVPYAYFVYMRNYRGNTEKLSSKEISIFFSLYLFCVILFEAGSIAISTKSPNFLLLLSIIEIFYVILMTALFLTMMHVEENETNLAILKQMWNEDRKQYQIQKENMDIINIKCHDLRHQIQNFRESPSMAGQEGAEALMNQLENSIYIYDSVIKTGNEVLDVILSNVSLRANQKKVQLTAMVDGKAVSFLEEADTYSLFGNMLDNALEYEDTLPDKSACFISLTVKKTQGFAHIHCENHYEGKNALKKDKKGNILTTKGDTINHGYGIKSMEQISKKYGGQFDVYIADGMFQVDILLPEPREEKTK